MTAAHDQTDALDPGRLGPRDRARFWRDRRLDGLECLSARFVDHAYATHSHETYVLGVIVEGAEAYSLRGVRRVARAGQVCVVHPDEPHDGAPVGGGYAYRMTYPSVRLMRAAAADALDGRDVDLVSFREPIIDDPELARRLVGLHRALGASGDRLERDEAFAEALALLVRRHGALRPPAPSALTGEAGVVGRVRARLDADPADDLGLDDLAGLAGRSRFHLIRAFKKHVGMTPHAYRLDRRVRAARRLLADGGAPADAAVACGFADQSHLTRAFKARVGVTPAAFRAARVRA